MTSVEASAGFVKRLRRLGPIELVRAEKSLIQFIENSAQPHLNFEKLKGSSCYTIRVDRNFRIVMRRLHGEHYQLIDVANHKTTDRKYG